MRRVFVVIGVAAGLMAGGVAVRLALHRHDITPSNAAGPRLLWSFEAPQPGFVVGAPVVSEDAIYLAIGHSRGFQQAGAVYALDPATGKPKWVYTDSGAMLHTASTPLVARGRVVVGEGLHNNFSCRLHCIDARTGRGAWTFPTQDHIEGGPALANGLVVFPAGNDGLYAVDLESGKEKWHFRADLHIDSTPFVLDGRVFAGSGPSRRFDALQAVCIDAATGKPIWRTPVKLPAWGSPVVGAGRVFIGLGNGRLTQADPVPAGGLACLDAATGKEIWTVSVPDAVFGRPTIAANRVVFGSRDGYLRGISFAGEEIFRIDLAGPVMASPVADGEVISAVSISGRVIGVNAADGRELWRYELRERGSEPRMYASPTLVGKQLLVAGEMMAGQLGVVCLHCFELPEIVRP
jgi:outer membrane protein assembly factor BamB